MFDILRAKKVNLSASKITQTNIPPRETVSYCKETQTPHEVHEREGKIKLGESGKPWPWGSSWVSFWEVRQWVWFEEDGSMNLPVRDWNIGYF